MINVLIFSFLIAVTAQIFASLSVMQNKENRAVQEKLAVVEARKLVASALYSPGVCGYIFDQPTPLSFDATHLPSTIDLDSARPLPASFDSGLPGSVIARINSAPAASADWVKIRSIELNILSGGVGNYSGTWTISVESEGLVRPLAPIRIPANLKVDDSVPTQAQVTECLHPTLPKTMATQVVWSKNWSCGGDPTRPNCLYSNDVYAACPTGYAVAGCGHELSWNPQPNGNGDDRHTNAPDSMWMEKNRCYVHAGGAPGCGVCFRVQALCVRAQ